VHGVVFAFCAAQGLRKDAIDGLHQYWDECLNFGQFMTVTEVCRYGGLFAVAGRDRPNVAKAPGKADAASTLSQVGHALAHPLHLVPFG